MCEVLIASPDNPDKFDMYLKWSLFSFLGLDQETEIAEGKCLEAPSLCF